MYLSFISLVVTQWALTIVYFISNDWETGFLGNSEGIFKLGSTEFLKGKHLEIRSMEERKNSSNVIKDQNVS